MTSWPKASCPRASQPPAWPWLPDSTPRCNKSTEAADLSKKSIANPPASPLKDRSRRLLQVLLTKVIKTNVTVSCKSSTSSWPRWSPPIRPPKRCATRMRLRIPRHRRWFGCPSDKHGFGYTLCDESIGKFFNLLFIFSFVLCVVHLVWSLMHYTMIDTNQLKQMAMPSDCPQQNMFWSF